MTSIIRSWGAFGNISSNRMAPRGAAAVPASQSFPEDGMPADIQPTHVAQRTRNEIRLGRRISDGQFKPSLEAQVTIQEEEEEPDDESADSASDCSQSSNSFLYLPSPHHSPASSLYNPDRRRGSLSDLRKLKDLELNSPGKRSRNARPSHHRSMELLLPRQNSLPTIPETATPLSPGPPALLNNPVSFTVPATSHV